MDGGRENAIEMRAGAWLNGLSGGIAVPVGIASGPLLDKDGSEVCRILGLYWVFTYVVFFVLLNSYESRLSNMFAMVIFFYMCWP
jgi:hypothetical protein